MLDFPGPPLINGQTFSASNGVLYTYLLPPGVWSSTPAPSGLAGGDLVGAYPNPTIKSGVVLTGDPTRAEMPPAGDSDSSIPTTAWVQGEIGTALTGTAGGDLAGSYPNPTIKPGVNLTGVPIARTAGNGTNTEQLATTQFVNTAVAGAIGGSVPTGPAGGDLAGTYPDPTLKTSLVLAGNPTLTASPAAGDNDLSVPTTAWVQNEISLHPMTPEAVANRFTVASVAAGRLLTTRPGTVVTQGYATAGDGGGGTWIWFADSTLTDDGARYFSPAGLPLGRYQRLWSIRKSMRWFGAVGDGIADDTTAVIAALSTGGSFVIDGTFLINAITVTVSGLTMVGTSNATFRKIPGTGGNMLRIIGDNTHIEGITFDASTAGNTTDTMLYLEGHRYRLERLRLLGVPYNCQTPNVTPAPYYALFIGNATRTLFEDGLINDIYTVGGNNGIVISGGKRTTLTNINGFLHAGYTCVLGGGLAMPYTQCSNIRGVCDGQYAFSNSGMFGASMLEPHSFIGWQLNNMYAENTGWRPFFTSVNTGGGIGSGKFGYDITDDGLNQFYMQAMARNCCVGGMESKSGTFEGAPGYITDLPTTALTASGNELPFASTTNIYLGMRVSGGRSGPLPTDPMVPQPNIPADTYVAALLTGPTRVQLTRALTGSIASGAIIRFSTDPEPYGHRNTLIDFQYVSELDKGQTGVHVRIENDYTPANFADNQMVRAQVVTQQASSWRSLFYKKPFDIVASNGLAWLCFGTSAGQPAQTGMTAPAAGGVYRNTTASSATASGAVLHLTNATGVAAGQRVFGTNIPDMATVLSVAGSDVTISTNVTSTGVPSGSVIIIGTMHNDGGVYWFCLGPDTSGASTTNQGVSAVGVSNVTFDVDVTGCSRGVLLDPGDNIATTMNGVKCRARVRRPASYGVQVNSSNASNVLTGLILEDCDIEAVIPVYQTGTVGTITMDVIGGRFVSTNNAAIRFDGATNTVRIDGGAYFYSQVAALVINGGTNTIRLGTCTIEGGSGGAPTISMSAGSGTIDFGSAATYRVGGSVTVPGWRVTGGTMTTRGRLQRQELSTAPTTTTAGNVGEYMSLAAPTATEWGYVCTVADFVTPLYTWKKLPLV